MSKPKKLKIAVITSTRAEYGLLKPLMDLINSDAGCELCLYVTGTHLEKKFGYTLKDILADKFVIKEKIKFPFPQNSLINMAKTMGHCVVAFTKVLTRDKPDVLVILGDRFEAFAVATSAYISRIPIAHIHGGETTAGAMDEAFRHSITKMASLQLTATSEYRHRVIQLGENPKRVFNVGAPGVDTIKSVMKYNKAELSKRVGFSYDEPTALVNFHPATLESESPLSQIDNLLNALSSFPKLNLLFTAANADQGGQEINERIAQFVSKRPNAKLVQSLGTVNFLNSLRHVSFMIGNSSSGIIEMPYFKKPTIDIGNRQRGRMAAMSVIHCECAANDIRLAIEKALSPSFIKKIKNVKSPYGNRNTAKKILDLLKKEVPQLQYIKDFYDLK